MAKITKLFAEWKHNASPGKQVIFLAIADDGIGIGDEHQRSVFEPFQQAIPNSKHKGTGLGLSICVALVRRMKGEIWLRSKRDIGAIFFVALPLLQVGSESAKSGGPESGASNMDLFGVPLREGFFLPHMMQETNLMPRYLRDIDGYVGQE